MPRGIRVDRDGPGGRVSSPTNDRTHGTGACRENLAMPPRPRSAVRPQGLLPVGMATSHCSVGAAVDAAVVTVAACQGARLPFFDTFAIFFFLFSFRSLLCISVYLSYKKSPIWKNQHRSYPILYLFVLGVTGQVRTGSSKQPYSQDKPSKSRVINNRVSKRCV